jgi:two-component system invasion response regulator UvrY
LPKKYFFTYGSLHMGSHANGDAQLIKVLVVDDHELVRTGICRMLVDTPEIQVVGEAESGEQAIELARQHKPDVVLLDVNMPGIGGVETTRRLLQSVTGIKVLAVSGLSEEPYPSMLLKAGASGYITKGAPLDEMVRAIRKVMQGGKYFSADIAEQLASSYLSDQQNSPFDLLSEREMQVAMMVVNCISAQEISDRLFVSVKTVNTYRYRIFEKLQIDSDVKLTHLAMRYRLITP